MNRNNVEDKARICVNKIMVEEKTAKLLNKLKDYDEDIFYHAINTAFIVAQIGINNKYSEPLLHSTIEAALLYNIGLINVPLEIVNSEKALTEEQFKQLKEGLNKGIDILEDAGYNEVTIKCMTTQISAEENVVINEAKKLLFHNLIESSIIVDLANKYDAMTSERPYRNKKTAYEALSILYEENKHTPEYVDLINNCSAI